MWYTSWLVVLFYIAFGEIQAHVFALSHQSAKYYSDQIETGYGRMSLIRDNGEIK